MLSIHTPLHLLAFLCLFLTSHTFSAASNVPGTPAQVPAGCSFIVSRENVSQRRVMSLQDVINANTQHQCVPKLQSANCRANSCYNQKFRTLDGTCNNQLQPLFGAAFSPYTRLMLPVYDDGQNAPFSEWCTSFAVTTRPQSPVGA